MGNLGSFTLGPCFGQDKHLPLTAWYLEISLLLKALMLVFINMLYVYDIYVYYLPPMDLTDYLSLLSRSLLGSVLMAT